MRGKICKRVINSLKPGSAALFVWDSELRGFGFKVTPKGKRVYVVQYRMGGRGFVSRRYTIGPHGLFTPDEARERARKILQNVHDGIDPMQVKKAQQVETVEKLVEAFLESRKQKGRKSVGQIKRVLEKDLKAWRGRAVASITKSDIHQLLDGIVGRGSPVIANRALTHLKTMFAWARSRGYVMQSPAEGIEKPSEEIARDRAPNNDELAEIWAATTTLDWPFEPAIKLLILTGQRREEVGQMRWSELHLDEGIWRLPGVRTKNGQPHDIHLSTEALEVLRTVTEIEDCDFVFSTNGKTPISGWSKAKRRLGDEILVARKTRAHRAGKDPNKEKAMPGWRLHDLRRTVATGLNDLGVTPIVADRILNHVPKKQKGQVMFVYNRAEYVRERRDALTLWGAHVAKLATPSHPVKEKHTPVAGDSVASVSRAAE